MANYKGKYYVVWKGQNPGIYDSWEECKQQVENYQGARYKAFSSQEEAVEAYRSGPDNAAYKKKKSQILVGSSGPFLPSISVDAACSGNPGKMEYRGVDTASKIELFRSPVFEEGTNNIGEFLAIAHALGSLEKQGRNLRIYSDSSIAINWIKQGKCKTKLVKSAKNADLFNLIERAEGWLATHPKRSPVFKWETEQWGENPADFGRK